MPNISVCIPTYNREHLLKETLESVFAQTYKDFEVVIVDDGSTDGTKEMLEKNGFNVRYYWQENQGDATTRNKLIKLANGKYISFLDSDDLLYPDSLEQMAAAMPNNAEDVVVYGPYVAIDEKGDILHRRRKRLYNGRITKRLFEDILIHSCGSLFPKKILVEAGGFNPALNVCSDYDLWLRLSLKYDFISLRRPVFKRRRHSGNISKISFANRSIEYKVLEDFYFKGGGSNVIPHRWAMIRLSKELYRVARSAVRESMKTKACELLKKSLKQHFSLKTILWLGIAQGRLHPSLWISQDYSDRKPQSRPAAKRNKSISDIKVVMDFNPVLVNKFSGFYTFGIGLLKGLSQLEERPEMIMFCSSQLAAKAEELKEYEKQKIFQFRTPTINMRWLENFWNYFDYPKLQYLTGNFDVYHCYHHLMPPTSSKPRLMTVHDLRRYKLPQLYPKSKLAFFEAAVKRADHFLAVSQSTKNDLCSIFGIKEDKVDIISHATEIEPFEITFEQKNNMLRSLSEKLGRQIDDYFIAISSPDSRKNISRIVEAFETAKKSLRENIILVVIGQLPKREKEFSDRIKGDFYSDVFWAGTVDDLRPWFGCAKALIFASLYEGFGIPILEAFACGTAVITSNISSMPEVADDAALYVDPFSTESIAGGIGKISNDERLRRKLTAAGVERNKLFTWEKTAKKVVEVYSKLAGI
ncbi:MAG: glycosyltransferase [Sedimentisphaerales bacterium]